MSLTCPKCLKKMQTSQKLQAHLKRKNPCDKVCLICGKKYANQRGFNSHRKTHMQEMVQDNKAEEIIEELEQVQHLSPLRKYKAHRANFLKTKRELPLQVKWLKEAFPLEDFEVDTIVVEREETRTINNQVIFEKVTYERIVIRGRIIEELLQWGPLNAVLEALKHKSNKQEIINQSNLISILSVEQI
jgi:hypothetical protein